MAQQFKQLVLPAVLLAVSGQANAAILTSGNSQITMNTFEINEWSVDGVGQLFTHQLWYRIDGDSYEDSLDNLGPQTITASGNTAQVTYAGRGFEITVDYTLSGGQAGSGASDLAASVTIDNLSSTTTGFSLFQYADFDLGSSYFIEDNAAGDSLQQGIAVNVIGLQQIDGNTMITEGTSGLPAPTFYQAGDALDLEDLLWDSFVTDFDANNPSYSGADVAWVWQWDLDIATGGTAQISKDMQLTGVSAVPVPAAVWLFGSGLVGLVGVARRRGRKTASISRHQQH